MIQLLVIVKMLIIAQKNIKLLNRLKISLTKFIKKMKLCISVNPVTNLQLDKILNYLIQVKLHAINVLQRISRHKKNYHSRCILEVIYWMPFRELI